jgi:hypothetical protein
MGRRYNYETPDPDPWPDAVRVDGWPAVAVWIRGWQTEPDEDTEWSGYENRTGMLVATMVGDDAQHLIDPGDVITLPREDYCGECGQIGCGHDGLDRD